MCPYYFVFVETFTCNTWMQAAVTSDQMFYSSFFSENLSNTKKDGEEEEFVFNGDVDT
jgi:hypothetical protein